MRGASTRLLVLAHQGGLRAVGCPRMPASRRQTYFGLRLVVTTATLKCRAIVSDSESTAYAGHLARLHG